MQINKWKIFGYTAITWFGFSVLARIIFEIAHQSGGYISIVSCQGAVWGWMSLFMGIYLATQFKKWIELVWGVVLFFVCTLPVIGMFIGIGYFARAYVELEKARWGEGMDDRGITDSIGAEFVLIPAGEFEMGSPEAEEDKDGDEGPVHHVTIEKAFYMGRYEVTQREWRDVMGDNPSYFKGDDLPVEQVSYVDVRAFIRKLNKKGGTYKYRLPSEAEWEYACRAGTTTRYSFGDDESKLGDYVWYCDNSGDKTHPVGEKKPNPYGLYDMHGNVKEWVQDRYHDDYNGAPTDGSAWESGYDLNQVFRGGCWNSDVSECWSAYRDRDDPVIRDCELGFRLVRMGA